MSLDWLPSHKCGLRLTHNEHLNYYEDIITQNYEIEDFVSEDEYHKAIETNECWALQWYPNSPVGFHAVYASSLEALEQYFRTRSV
jgi:hypothetical protein